MRKTYFIAILLVFLPWSNITSSSVFKSVKPETYQTGSGVKIVTGNPDLKIKIKKCEVNGNVCTLDLLVTNHGKDTRICFNGGSRETKVYDDEGNIYTETDVNVLGAGQTNAYSYGEYISYPSGVPVKFRIIIKGISDEAKTLTRIVLQKNGEYGKEDPVMFYNIPISREGDE